MSTPQRVPSEPSPEESPPPPRVSPLRQVRTVFGVGILLATLFTALTPVGLLAKSLAGKVSPGVVQTAASPPTPEAYPTPTARPRPRVGIVAGHWRNDSGAVCSDGLTEAEVNLNIATLVKQKLIEEGFDVDLLEEFDYRLAGYRGLALVSIHADSCEYINAEATGFKVAAALSSTNTDRAQRLTACLRSRYEAVTGLPFHSGSITGDMTRYHAFDEIHHETTAAIIETGFLNLDRQILTQSPELVAEGITRGILCFIYNEDVTTQPRP